MRKFLEQLGLLQERYVVYNDSKSGIHLSKTSTFHLRSMHIDFMYQWIRDVLKSKQLYFEKVYTSENEVDMLKSLLRRT